MTFFQAAEKLREVCDGAKERDNQGYNGVDRPIVDDVLDRPHDRKGAYVLRKILKKYKRQLHGMGIDYDALEIPKDLPDNHLSPNGGGGREVVPSPSRPPLSSSPKRKVPTLEEFLKAFPFDKFPTMRPAQREALKKIHKAWFIEGKKFAILEAPTGVGKSNIGMTPAKYFASEYDKTFFLTIQNLLIDQYLRDFPAPEIEFCKGRRNFVCNRNGQTCDNGECKQEKKGILHQCIQDGSKPRQVTMLQAPIGATTCPYWEQMLKVGHNRIALFNFSSYLCQRQVGRFLHSRLMLVDEAHNIEQQLMSHITLELTSYALRHINMEIDRNFTEATQIVEWLADNRIIERCDAVIGDTGDDEGGEEDDTFAASESLRREEIEAVQNLKGQIQNFLQYLEKADWIVDMQTTKFGKKAVCRPIGARNFAKDLLFNNSDYVLLMSATILDADVYSRNLGLEKDEYAFIQVDSDFPVERRPIYLDTAGNMSRRYIDQSMPKFLVKVGEILENHREHRGIIHCHSYNLLEALRALRDERLLFQPDFPTKDDLFETHAHKSNGVIVAPAMHEGLDLKGDLGRFQIVAKVPYPSLGDKVIKKRMELDDEYYGWLTSLKLVQEFGRIVRSKDDWGITYIVDSGVFFYLKKNSKMIPNWIRKAVRQGSPDLVEIS